jgi:hypothetical protein
MALPELEDNIGSPAGAEAPKSLGPVLEGEGADPLDPVLLQLAPVALPLQHHHFVEHEEMVSQDG